MLIASHLRSRPVKIGKRERTSCSRKGGLRSGYPHCNFVWQLLMKNRSKFVQFAPEMNVSLDRRKEGKENYLHTTTTRALLQNFRFESPGHSCLIFTHIFWGRLERPILTDVLVKWSTMAKSLHGRFMHSICKMWVKDRSFMPGMKTVPCGLAGPGGHRNKRLDTHAFLE